jgi:hypothetical protein
MLLTESDREKVLSWISSKCGQMRCICCGNGKWTLLDSSSLVIGFDMHSTRFHYHQGIPLIAIACMSCGHVVFFSSGVLGFKPDEPKEEVSKTGA